MQLSKMKRVEILLEEQLVPKLGRIVREAGFSGHTVMPVLQGSGGGGAWQDERLTGSSKVMLLAIGTAEDAGQLLEAIAPLLDSHRLLLTIGEVEVIRRERF
ncbi:P-II family nitrogen regulator [Sphingomicrobium astaxanthinifaciens]|uniref:P-II family nitrogen regulator n=1 Tax=Sphingomicrobium astaxanthinifaciens TaxID=1227949 RepID=UPI001FCA5559|nr:hypothetical protein [Sphingomicrobium astaxanthinifaciens]MCJ7422384.1 hypothetical protein [Sphingomicrobium astaxanthinifaciens]